MLHIYGLGHRSIPYGVTKNHKGLVKLKLTLTFRNSGVPDVPIFTSDDHICNYMHYVCAVFYFITSVVVLISLLTSSWQSNNNTSEST